MAESELSFLNPVRRQALSDAVFEQLRGRIVSGDLAAGESIPSERALCEALGVNRSSVREAMRRLEQARLVSVRHGGTSRVLEYRESAGLDLLPALITTEYGFDAQVVRGILEMRSAIAADAARLAAERATPGVADQLETTIREMRGMHDDLSALQDAAITFWSTVIDASANLAYRLAYNSLRETYDQCRELLARALSEELTDWPAYAAIAGAIRRRDAKACEQSARGLVRRGEQGIKRILDELEGEER